MSVEPAVKSPAVRLYVPKLDLQLPAAQQADGIRLGLAAAEVLTAWAMRHTQVLAAL
jgi:hypothetical protein